MKITTISKFLAVGVLTALTFSCVKDTDYDIPNYKREVSKFDGAVKTIDQVKAMATAEVTDYSDNDALEGYIVSSDEGGNFYQKLYIQNEEKTAAFTVAVEGSGLYGQFPLGAKVQVRLKGLSTQLVNGALEVGYKTYQAKNGTVSVGRVPKAVYGNQLLVVGDQLKTLSDLAKSSASIADLAVDANTNMLVTLENVQFSASDVGKTLHVAANDKFAGTDYNLTDSKGQVIVFRTSRYAKFKDEKVPSGKFNITGVLTKYRNKFQFMVSLYENIVKVGEADNQDNSVQEDIPALDASSATATDYVAGKKVKLTGVISVENKRSYITFSDGTKIQIFAPSATYKNLSQDAKTKLKTNGQKVTMTGVFTDYTLKDGTVVKEIVYSSEADLEFGEVTATDTTTQPTTEPSSETNTTTDGTGSAGSDGGTTTGGDTTTTPPATTTEPTAPTTEAQKSDRDGQTAEKAFTVAEALAKNNSGETAWVKGYIVGVVEGNNTKDARFNQTSWTKDSNIIIADSKDETDINNCLIVELKSRSAARTALNLKSNSGNLKKQVSLKGALQSYFGTKGLKGVKNDYVLNSSN